MLSLLCAAVACVWPPLAVPERPDACPAARSATTLRGNDLEAQLSSADDSGGNKEASINASDIVKRSDEAATPPPAVPSDAALAGDDCDGTTPAETTMIKLANEYNSVQSN